MTRDKITALVARVKEAYPPERIEASKRRLRAVWSGTPAEGGVPFVFRGAPGPTDPDLAAHSRQTTHEDALLYQLGQILDRSVLADDYVPGLSPGLRQVTLPSIFGAQEVASGGHNWVKPVIQRPEDVYGLPEPNYENNMAGFMLQRARYFQDMTNGEISVRIPDLQGPFSVASQLWGVQNFFLALYEHPDEANELLRKTTDATIEYIGMLKEAIGENLAPIHCHPEGWMPADAGICISEDLIAVVSPATCREFIAPGLEALGRSFGACYVHTCGDAVPCLDVLMAIPNLRGMNFATSETDVAAVAARTGGSWVIFPHTSPVASAHLRLLTAEEHARLCFSTFRKHNVPGFVFINCPPGLALDDQQMLDLVDRLREWAAGGIA